MSATPSRPGTKPEVDPENEKIIRERIATADDEPRQDAREAVEEIRRKLKQAVPR